MTDIVHCGWMTKSPPERKLNTPFKIFRSQWKRRWFVLRKPSGSLPDQYELHYYKDRRCNSKKGSIDLEQCEQIIESLDSESFPYLLAIKTYYRNKVRTYYLAVDSEQDMSQWVQWLCHVCGLKPEDTPTDIPDPKPVTMGGSGGHVSSANTGSSPSNGGFNTGSAFSHSGIVESQPINIELRAPSESSLSSSPSYIPLEKCTSGPAPRRESTGSMPNFMAPSIPPHKKDQIDGGAVSGNDDDVFDGSGLYMRPPRHSIGHAQERDSDLYKVPPARHTRTNNTIAREEESRNTSYDIPPPRPDHSPKPVGYVVRKDSSGARSSSPTEFYDYPPSHYPPPRLDSTTSSESDLPPERPPKPAGTMQSPYQNLPPASKGADGAADLNMVPAPPKPHNITSLNSGYDVPRSSGRVSRAAQPSLQFVTHPAAPPRPYRQPPGNHAYFNTQGKRPSSGELKGDDSRRDSSDSSDVPPAIPPSRHVPTPDQHDGRSGSPHSVYQVPPSSASSSSSGSSGAPARPPARTHTSSPALSASPRGHDISSQENGGIICSTSRTKSFKRQHNINSSPKTGIKSQAMPVQAPVTAPRPAFLARARELSASDKEDEETTHHPLSLLHSVPPPFEGDRELKYIDLALPDTAQDAPRTMHSHNHSHGASHVHSHVDRSKDSATEYREIDFVKTQALEDTKKVKEKERKSDDLHN